MTEKSFPIDLMSRLAGKLLDEGYSEADVEKMCESNEKLAQFRAVLENLSEITTKKHIIDCNMEPKGSYRTEDMKLVHHQKDGLVVWERESFDLFETTGQEEETGKYLWDVIKELDESDVCVMNACVLEYLKENQALIPEEWMGYEVIFWGTHYRSGQSEYARSLYFDENNNKWIETLVPFGNNVESYHLALIHAEQTETDTCED
jgi:hypothetical protein